MQREEYERLMDRKAKLRMELEKLRLDRINIDKSLADEVITFKTPI